MAEDEQHSLLDELEGRGFEIEARSGIDRSLRLAVALHALMDRGGAIAGTVNCAGSLLRFDERIGICACLGVACETARGRPLSCTGDQPAAIAAYLARRVGGAALYAEVYAPDATADAALVLGGPEADPAWAADDGTVRISPTRYVPGLRGDGAGVDFRLATGPATLLALAPTGRRWTLVCALGEIVESRYRAVRGPNGMFRFERRPVVEAVSALASAGATHHVALAPGHLDVEARTIAAFIDAELCEV